MTPTELHHTFLTHAARLLAQAQRYVVSVDEAQDIVQDAFEAIWKRRDRLTEMTAGEALSYFSTTVRHLSLNRLRDLSHIESGDTGPAIDESGAQGAAPSPETIMMGRERMERLQRLINCLPAKQARAFTLFHLDGLETAEIAASMNETESYVRLLLSRARKELKSKI